MWMYKIIAKFFIGLSPLKAIYLACVLNTSKSRWFWNTSRNNCTLIASLHRCFTHSHLWMYFFYVNTHHNLVALCTFLTILRTICPMFNRNSADILVSRDSTVTDALVLNKHQNISDHHVDYIVSLWLYESYCTILVLLGRDSICSRSTAKTLVPYVSWVSAQNPASVSLVPVGSTRDAM